MSHRFARSRLGMRVTVSGGGEAICHTKTAKKRSNRPENVINVFSAFYSVCMRTSEAGGSAMAERR